MKQNQQNKEKLIGTTWGVPTSSTRTTFNNIPRKIKIREKIRKYCIENKIDSWWDLSPMEFIKALCQKKKK